MPATNVTKDPNDTNPKECNMPGIKVRANFAERQLSFPWLAGFTLVPAGDTVSTITGESFPSVELYAPRTAFRQPKGAKHAPKAPSTKVLNDRAWKVSKATRFECGCGICMSYDPFEWRGDRKPRSEAKREAIAETMHHARELDDHEAVMEDGFASSTNHEPITYTTSTTQSTNEAKEASTMKHTKSTATNHNGSIAQPRPSGRRMSKGMPPRVDCTIEPSLTIAPDPQSAARKAEDAKFLARRPVDPTTRKAEPVLPEGVWSLDDLLDDRKMVRIGA